MDMNKRMWNRHKKALLDGVRNATDSDMQARFTELLVNMVEQEVMAAAGGIEDDTEKSADKAAGICAVQITVENAGKSNEEMQKDFQEITEAAMPMLEYLNKHYAPHVSAVITEGRVTIIRDEISCPLPVRD